VKGATFTTIFDYIRAFPVSIHAPVKGATLILALAVVGLMVFQSTRP